MFEIDHSRINKWERANANKNAPLAPRSIDILCPNHECRRSLVNLQINWVVVNQFLAWTRITCAGCEEAALLILFDPPQNNSNEAIGASKVFIHPSPPIYPVLPEGIDEISPDFVRIYEQAITAEKLKLSDLDGVGYRKALEFLIKDYLCSKMPEESGKIKDSYLGKCINDYVEDPKIKSCAQLAAWLGNDETHYIRQWQDKDKRDLLILLELTLHWISSEILTQKYIESMSS